MQLTNLCFLREGDKVLLAMKKRGFGVGKWNGAGGKTKDGESVTASAVRELEEELGVEAAEADLHKCAELAFNFRSHPDWNQLCSVFLISKWRGEPQETEEMRPRWYVISELPFREMWSDDIHWFPLVLSGKNIKATFHFLGSGEDFDDYKVEEVAGF